MGELFNRGYLFERRRALRRRQTPAERIIWSQVRNRRLHGLKFTRQYSVGNYILDFYCQAKNLAVEIDGGHHAKPEEREYDRRRTEYLNAVGIRVIRFWNEEVFRNCEDVVARISAAAGVGHPLSPSKDIEGGRCRER